MRYLLFLLTGAALLVACKKPNDDPTATGTNLGFAHIKNVRITVTRLLIGGSNTPALPNTDSCIVNLRTGKVYALKDGTANATNADILYSISGNAANPDVIEFASPDSYYNAGLGTPAFDTWLKQWNTLRKTQFQNYYDGIINVSEWANINTAADITRVNKDAYEPDNRATSGSMSMSLLTQKTLFAFITTEGRRGLIKFTGSGKKTSTLYWVTFDIKIQQ